MMQQKESQENSTSYLQAKSKPKTLLETLKEKRDKKENSQVNKKEKKKEKPRDFFDKIRDEFLDKTLTSNGQRDAFRQFIDDISQKQESTLDRLRRLSRSNKDNS